MTIHYKDDSVTLHHGDCLDVLREIPDNSVDAVITDPPYGLEFMGKDWDGADGFRRSLNPADAGRNNVYGRTSRTSPEYRTTSKAAAGMSGTGYTDGANRLERPSHLGGLNPKCRNCGRWQRGGNPCKCDAPDFPNERLPRLHSFQEWCEAWAVECLRVLKPGGHMLAFGGSRTWHRLTCAVEDAGFEIRDSIAWLYGSGFPKSLDVSKAIDKAAGAERKVIGSVAARMPQAQAKGWGNPGVDNFRDAKVGTVDMDITAPATEAAQQWQGWGTALKPAFEPIVVARKPLAGTVAGNVLEHGTGALNIDACRTGTDGGTRDPGHDSRSPEAVSAYGHGLNGRSSERVAGLGRWPTNVVLDDYQAAELDRQTGTLTSGKLEAHHTRNPKEAGILGAFGSAEGERGYGDSGGASRFFPVFRYEAKAPSSERPRDGDTAHPTVKPLDLMRWLVRLVTPPGGTVLEPFAGSGTTAEACVIEGFKCIAIEREADYLPLIVKRLDKPIQMGFTFEDGGAA